MSVLCLCFVLKKDKEISFDLNILYAQYYLINNSSTNSYTLCFHYQLMSQNLHIEYSKGGFRYEVKVKEKRKLVRKGQREVKKILLMFYEKFRKTRFCNTKETTNKDLVSSI